MGELNYIEVRLPSNGKLKDIPAVIHAKPLNLHALKIISSINSDNEVAVEEAITDIINYLTKEKIDSAEFPLPDRIYILIVLRINGWSEWYDVPWTCPSCGKKITNSPIDLSKANIVPIKDEYKEPAKLTLRNGDTISIRLPRGKDIVEAHRYAEKIGLDNETEVSFLQVCSTISAINNEPKTIGEVYKYADEYFTGRDYALIRTFYEEYSYGYDGKSRVKCPKCNKEVEIDVPFRADTFFAYNVSRDDLKNAIRFE